MIVLRYSEGKKEMPGVWLMGSAVCLEQVIPLCTVHTANVLFLLIFLRQSHRGSVWSVLLEELEGVGGNCLLSLFLMSPCKNQKQREEKGQGKQEVS